MYKIWKIPKRKGGFRIIESPEDSLKIKQKESLEILKKIMYVSPFAHGFMEYRNIVTMAMPHVGKKWVLSMDIKDFFPSIKLNNFMLNNLMRNHKINEDVFKNLLEKHGGKIVLSFKNIYDLDDISELIKIHFYDFNDGKGLRLPQGAPGSPFLSNVFMHNFDWTMAHECYKYDLDYSRYADDITISGENKKDLIRMFAYSMHQLWKYDLEINYKKTKYMPSWRRQLVCGIVVNEKINLPRKWRKRLRAEIFQESMKGGGLPETTKGRMSFLKMVSENKKKSFSSRQIISAQLVKKALSS